MESGILMIVIVVIGVFYPVYTAWISLVAAPVYLKIGFLFAMAGALLVVLLYPYKCWEEGCYNLAFDGIYCEQHRAEKIEESKREEEESRSYEEYLKRIEEDPLWELKQRSRKNTPAQRKIPSVQKNLQNPYAAYDAGYDDVMEGDDYDWDRYRRDSEYADGVDDALDEREEYGRDDW